MNLYTIEQWQQDGSFKAEAGQEISEDVYNEMLNVMPPASLPRGKAEQALQDYDIPVHAGFLMGEPHSSNKNGDLLYLAFGMNNFGKGKRFYYLVLSIKEPELNGDYYFFDCMNAFVTDRYFKVSAFKSDADAISTAANYEATLYRYTFKDGERVNRTVLYDPWACMEETGAGV